MLRIAQIEAGTRRAGFAPVDLSGLLAGLAETYAAVAEDRGQSLRAAVEPGVVVTGDKELLAQLFANLIENALTHTPPGSRVEVALAREGRRAGRDRGGRRPGHPRRRCASGC